MGDPRPRNPLRNQPSPARSPRRDPRVESKEARRSKPAKTSMTALRRARKLLRNPPRARPVRSNPRLAKVNLKRNLRRDPRAESKVAKPRREVKKTPRSPRRVAKAKKARNPRRMMTPRRVAKAPREARKKEKVRSPMMTPNPRSLASPRVEKAKVAGRSTPRNGLGGPRSNGEPPL